MKRQLLLLLTLLLSCALTSCGRDEISLGDGFKLSTAEDVSRYFSCIEVDVPGRETISIIQNGKIESYGYNATYVVAKKTGGHYCFFEKAAAIAAVHSRNGDHPLNHVKGFFTEEEYKKKALELNLPPLVPAPSW